MLGIKIYYYLKLDVFSVSEFQSSVKSKGSVIFYQEGGLLKIGGSGTLSKIKRGDHLYFLKK